MDRMKNASRPSYGSSPYAHYSSSNSGSSSSSNQETRSYPRPPPSQPTESFGKKVDNWIRALIHLILLPFVWIYSGLAYLVNTLIVKPLTWLYEEIKNTLYHLTKGIQHLSSALFALLKIALFLGVCYLVFTFVSNSGILKTAPNMLAGLQHLIPPILGKNCSATLPSGQCSPNKPSYCQDGQLIDNPDACGCPAGMRPNNQTCISQIACPDGTLWPDCSQNKPYQCVRGQLVENPSLCGCPDNYSAQNGTCVLIQRCNDGTIYSQCSLTQPKFCTNGALIDRATVCGCPGSLTIQGDSCVSPLQTDPKSMSYPYVLRGSRGSIPFTTYSGLDQYLAAQPRSFTCYNGNCPTQDQMTLSYLSESNEGPSITALAGEIKSITPNTDDQARIAVSMVQNMPYDYASFNAGVTKGRYPYETLYEDTGVCGDKSMLLASLLRELGYGTALLQFNTQNHMAVGIKCPAQYAYQNTGYCFIESTTPNIITFSDGDYVGVGKLNTAPNVIPVSDGAEFSSVQQDYSDAQRYDQIIGMGPTLDMATYNEWLSLADKYGLQTSQNSNSGTTASQTSTSGFVQSPGTNGACGHSGEACCEMVVQGSNSASVYDICSDNLRCVNHQCVG